MIEFYKIKLKQIAIMFIAPLIIEALFILLAYLFNKDTTIPIVEALWRVGVSFVMLYIVLNRVVNEYYLNTDGLLNVLPYPREMVMLILTGTYVLFLLVLGILGEIFTIVSSNTKYSLTDYTIGKLLSVLSLGIVTLLAIILMKNLTKVGIGIFGISTFVACVTAAELYLVYEICRTHVSSWSIGILLNGPTHPIFAGIVPLNIETSSYQKAISIVLETNLMNIGVLIVSLVLFGLLAKFKKKNYVPLR